MAILVGIFFWSYKFTEKDAEVSKWTIQACILAGGALMALSLSGWTLLAAILLAGSVAYLVGRAHG